MLSRVGKLKVAIAAAWALGASIYIASSPVLMHGVKDTLVQNSASVIEAFAREQSWYEAHGPWGFFWLLLFSGHYLLATRIAITDKHQALAAMSAAAIALSVVTGFSIGAVYLPPALCLLAGTLMILSSKLLKPKC